MLQAQKKDHTLSNLMKMENSLLLSIHWTVLQLLIQILQLEQSLEFGEKKKASMSQLDFVQEKTWLEQHFHAMDQELTLLFTINAPKQLMSLHFKKLKDKTMTHGFAQKEICTLDLKEDSSLQEMQKL